MIQLRDYQQQAIVELRKAFNNKHQRVVLCLPTGSGKSIVFSEMVRLAFEKGTKTLVLTDRTELFKQTMKHLGRVGVPVEEISPAKKNIYRDGLVYLAMIETLKRRKMQFVDYGFELIICDEAHKQAFNDLFAIYPSAKVIGATATPVGKHFYEYYTHIVQNIDVPELVSQGMLAPCKPYQMVDSFDDLTSKRGEFTFDSLQQHYDKPKLYDGVIENWKKYAEGKKTIVFNCNIEHTKHMHEAFVSAGIASEYITSKTPDEERARILEAYTRGAFAVLNNCGILTTGWDEPSVECVIMNRATQSLPLWLQCVGRGSRIFPGKKEFVLLDFGGNHERLGLWNEPRTWKITKKKETSGVTPCKICPECLTPTHTTAPKCICGFIFEVKEKEIKKGVMVAVPPHTPKELIGRKIGDLSITELVKLQKAKKYKPTMIWRIIRSKGEEALKEYASKIGYSDGWIYKQKTLLGDSTFTNYTLS